MNRFASICVLAYKRPEMLERCINSLFETIDYPCEIILNCDGVDYIAHYLDTIRSHKISKVVVAFGDNRGVGRSFQNCLGVAEGDYVFKCDTDLVFEPHWLSRSVSILDNNSDIGAVSLFDYRHYDPDDSRFNHLEEREECIIVDDFVSSIYAFRTTQLSHTDFPKKIPDDGLHKALWGKLAITKEDLVKNSGFGKNSVYVSFDQEGKPFKTPTHDTPLLFGIEK